MYRADFEFTCLSWDSIFFSQNSFPKHLKNKEETITIIPPRTGRESHRDKQYRLTYAPDGKKYYRERIKSRLSVNAYLGLTGRR